jgi:CDP-6-deoxy-D-xylo-4-hexulose-3-dehydrase
MESIVEKTATSLNDTSKINSPGETVHPADDLRRQIQDLVTKYHAAAFPVQQFAPGASAVPISGKVFDAEDIQYAVDASLDFWLTTGRFAEQFERQFARVMGVRDARLVNSGSSANLVALSALTSSTLGDRALKPGDEVITVAAGFPTTLNPIIQNNLIPVFVDVQLDTYDLDCSQLEAAVSGRTRAVMIAHTLGNPFDLDAVTAFCKKYDLWLVEDCCDAVGATYRGQGVGTFGDISTASFYPAHHITMGEGGAVMTQKPALTKLIESFRDWGRDCWCAPGKDNTCGKRFEWELGELPCGYDHKYIYSHIGYNLKLSDMQAAVGVSQLKKLPAFITARRANFKRIYEGLSDLQEFFALPASYAKLRSELVWFSHRCKAGGWTEAGPRCTGVGATQDRNASSLWRKSDAAASVSQLQIPQDRRDGKYGLRDEQRLLDRGLSRTFGSNDQLCDRLLPFHREG